MNKKPLTKTMLDLFIVTVSAKLDEDYPELTDPTLKSLMIYRLLKDFCLEKGYYIPESTMAEVEDALAEAEDE